MSKISGVIFLGTLIAIWVFCLTIFGFNGIGIAFGIFGSILMGAAINGWQSAKATAYLANKYDESKK